jgi:zinc transporter ZupT
MALACLLTVLALGGVLVGLRLGTRHFSVYLGAAGGGLLFGMAAFWILPEIAGELNWLRACLLAAAACFGITLLDRRFEHSRDSRGQQVIGPLLLAAAIHSFLDGWSLRAVSNRQIANIVVPLGLALHKVPEGLALGWVIGHASTSRSKAAMACFLAEAMTVAGAVVEPYVDYSATRAFGAWWMAAVLAVIAGSFFFLGLHAILPVRRRAGVMAVFFVTVLSVGGIALLKS